MKMTISEAAAGTLVLLLAVATHAFATSGASRTGARHLIRPTAESAEKMSVTPFSQDNQSRRVTGKVTSSGTGEPLPGVNILEKGTSNGTVTDVDGRYSLEISDGAILVFSYIGFVSQEVDVAGRSVVDFAMEEDVQNLKEVVVVGYGTQREDLVTNAIGSFKVDESKFKISSLSPAQLLQGRIAGVNITMGSGNLGSRERVSIRGASSLSASNEPLYVVDGVPITNYQGDLYDFGEPMSSLSSLNLNDIESIEVLKDAASAAIYGSRATNGVILITTKSGKAGRTEINFNFNTGFSEFPNPNKVKYTDSDLYV
jgi:TonB-dependent SusC/RagA subfamily outer membrane receptor